MSFLSVTFLFYFLPIALIVYYITSFSRNIQNIWLFIVSIIFYAWGEPIFMLVLLGALLINTLFAIYINKFRSRKKIAKAFLTIICIINIGLLFIFKYLYSVIVNINAVSGKKLFEIPQIVLPLGISFITFRFLSYVIDIYRGIAKVEKNPLYVGLYIFFFPQLIAGPISQYSRIADQIKNRKSNWGKFSDGCCRFIFGLGKKILLANSFAAVANRIFDLSAIGQSSYDVPALLAWVGSIAYTLQIYFDFSGYSDMAIGLALMFGFIIDENFDYPYTSSSVTEFWHRWHISLMNWFKAYVYLPLKGSGINNRGLVIRNMLMVWLLIGVWHGANLTFILWGLWNFVFLIFEKFINLDRKEEKSIFRYIYLLFVVNIGWVLFRSANLYNAYKYFLNMFALNNNGLYSDLAVTFLKEYGIFFAFGIIFCMPISRGITKIIEKKRLLFIVRTYSLIYPFMLSALFIICIVYLSRGSWNTFIYFNF